MHSKRILLMNDLPGYGKVALSAMMPVLSHMGYELLTLPTALVSNTLDYGRFTMLETTDYMRECVKVWEHLGFTFDAICTGYIASQSQAEMIAEYCEGRKKNYGTYIVEDPIMGDHGRLYNGMTRQDMENRRRLCKGADLIVPNMTEAQFLADYRVGEMDMSREDMRKLTDQLREIGSGSIVITSAVVEGARQVYGYDAVKKEYFSVPYKYVPVRFPGTGDLFCAILTGEKLQGTGLRESVRCAVEALECLIHLDLKSDGEHKGIPVEQYWEELRRNVNVGRI